MSTHHPLFNVSSRTLLALVSLIFWTGTLTLGALALGAFVAVVSLINVTLDAVSELATHLAALYTSTDSLGKIVLLLVGLFLVSKLAPRVARSLRKSYHAVRRAIG